MQHQGRAEGGEKPNNLKLAKETAPTSTPETGAHEVTSALLKEKGHQIRQLSFNGLNKGEGRGYGERADEVKNLGSKLLTAGTHNEGYVYLDKEGNVAVFMELERVVGTDTIKVKQLRMAHAGGHGQSGMIQSLMRQAHEDFHGRGYHHLVIDTSNIRKDVGKAEKHLSSTGLSNFIRTEDGQTGAANDNLPSAEEDDGSERGPEKLAA